MVQTLIKYLSSLSGNGLYYINAGNYTEGLTPLHLAARYGTPDMVRALLNAGANINAKNNNGSTPLFYATLNENHNMVQVLLSANTKKIYQPNKDGDTALHWAARYGKPEMIKALIQALPGAGANINTKNSKHETPLHLAAQHGKYDNMRALLQDLPKDEVQHIINQER